MVPLVRYFEIPVHDLDRAIAFYQAVLGVTLERGEIDGNQMAFFPSESTAAGATGALAKGESYVPGKQGCRIYFGVESIDATLASVTEIGHRVLFPKTSIGELGFVAEFEDSEGNCIALHSKQG